MQYQQQQKGILLLLLDNGYGPFDWGGRGCVSSAFIVLVSSQATWEGLETRRSFRCRLLQLPMQIIYDANVDECPFA